MEALHGLAQESPLTAAVLLSGPFSTAGLPLLVGFFPRLQVLATLSGQAPSAAAVVLIGMAAAGAAGLRLLAALVRPQEVPVENVSPPVLEEPGLRIQPLTLLGIAAVFLVFSAGLLPGWPGRLAESLQGAFVHLLR
jgi:NADH:ubiquinone oxidoreductase subunit 2 (subunit N)